jgi:hypothetical protein
MYPNKDNLKRRVTIRDYRGYVIEVDMRTGRSIIHARLPIYAFPTEAEAEAQVDAWVGQSVQRTHN